MTESNIHVLSGFIVKPEKKYGEYVLDWATSLGKQEVYRPDSSATDITAFCGVDADVIVDDNWLRMVWCELLCSDLGYCKMSLNLVGSCIF